MHTIHELNLTPILLNQDIEASQMIITHKGQLMQMANNDDDPKPGEEDNEDFNKEDFASKESEEISKKTTERLTEKVKKEEEETTEKMDKEHND